MTRQPSVIEFATTDTLPQVGAVAGNYSFSTKQTSIFFENNTGVTAYVRVNGDAAADASTLDWHYTVAAGDVKTLNIRASKLSVWFPTGGTTDRTGGMGGSTSPATYTIWGTPDNQPG